MVSVTDLPREEILAAAPRFWRRVVKQPNGCWEWQASCNRAGYGTLGFTRKGKGDCSALAHRFSYVLHYGSFASDVHVLHRCDNRKCVNPDHLWLGTDLDNARDREAKGRGADRFGEKNPKTKLTFEEVAEVFSLRAQGLSCRRIGILFDVSATSIRNILKGKNWSKHPMQASMGHVGT